MLTDEQKQGIREAYAIGFAHATLKDVDEVLMDYIERVEKAEGAGLWHGRGVALKVKLAIEQLDRELDDTTQQRN